MKNEPLSKIQYDNLQLFWTIFDEVSVDEGYAIPFKEIYEKADELGIVLTKKRMLKSVQEKVNKLDPVSPVISIEKTSRGFILKGARWSSPGDAKPTLAKIFAEV